MASKNEPPLGSRDNDPVDTVKKLLCIVDELDKHLSPKMENSPSREASKIPVSLPPLGNNFEADLLPRLRSNLERIESRLRYLQELREDVLDEALRHYPLIKRTLQKVEMASSSTESSYCFSFLFTKGMKYDVEGISRKISDLVDKLSVLPNKSAIQKSLYIHDSSAYSNDRRFLHLPGLHENVEDLTKLQAFRQVKQEFMELQIERRICLLSFAVFPENREVHRTMLMYWWIGEGIIPVDGAEKTVREVLKDFTEKNLVEPVQERHKVASSSYKMTPFVHSSVIHLSKEIGLFDIYHKGEKPRMNKSEMGKVCLVEGSSKQPEAERMKMPSVDQIETVFNVSERYPDFAFKWFSESSLYGELIKVSKMFSYPVHVFYLGRWERTNKRHIEVRNPVLMRCLTLMENLKVLSFQGISTIRILENSVRFLRKLIVLDLRECYDLKKLPEVMDELQSLVHLDMTGCDKLEFIPMRLSLLKNLEVIKGFAVSDTIYEGVACNLNYLKRLKKLRKLSIEIYRNDLGVDQLMKDLVKLKALTSLRMTWRRDLNVMRAGKPGDPTKMKTLPHQLKKLDLRHFPHKELPTWLHPQNLLHLTKFHIGGGQTLEGFGNLPAKATKCSVEILRLTCLPKLRVRWIELRQIYFPNLIFLEKYECPRVSLTPCDGNGIWRSDQDD